ncbi:hypothetical protein B9479_001524 [Cryptococcus floricola]|uniref:Aspartate aminotransferase n=1 Tax=Cryptococcus floricola TaxID=2591691 RepID=A0A5D3B542_9TREE|nr:hypothetical protein B9479_001524 [Cryptococcus floricola]
MTALYSGTLAENYQQIEVLPQDIIFKLAERFAADKFPKKVTLGQGTYRNGDGVPWPLPIVHTAVTKLVTNPSYNHEYLTIRGDAGFLSGAAKLIVGDEVAASGRIASLQTCGGTGACHMGALHLMAFLEKGTPVYISDPTWDNHHAVFRHVGFETVKYPYYDPATRGLDFEAFLKTVEGAPEKSIFVLHAVGHNPTGCDPSDEQWTKLAQVFKARKHFAFFDCAYQGFVSGSFEDDRQSITIFNAHNIPMVIAQSLSKNAGLYGERLGAIHVLCESADDAVRVTEQLKTANRKEISTPPKFGAAIMDIIFSDPALMAQWKVEVKIMADRMNEMRIKLLDLLKSKGTPGDWSHIVKQRGMFSYTGLTAEQCETLTDKHHIYVPPSGRISVAGLNDGNVEYVAESIDKVVRGEV